MLEIEQAKSTINKFKRELQASQDQCQDLDSRLKKANADILTHVKSEQALELKTSDLREEVKVLELQLDEVHAKLQQVKDSDLDLRSQILKSNSIVESQAHRLSDLEALFKASQSNLSIIDNVGDRLAADLMAYLETIGSAEDSYLSPGTGSGSYTERWRSKSPTKDSLECSSAGLSHLGLFID